MERLTVEPRPDWQRTVESQGLVYHTVDGFAYWNESACYTFDERDASALENAANALHSMCLEAVDWLIRENALDLVGIPVTAHAFVRASWERRDPPLYGRFDLAYDGTSPPKLLEYNADTPTALVESAVAQWYWFKDVYPELDQFNTIHERLVERWGEVAAGVSRVHAACVYGSDEDWQTITYLRDTAMQAGLEAVPLAVEDIGWNRGRNQFVDEGERPIDLIFKLYPWEWLFGEPFSASLVSAPTRWVEPPWKAILSSKAILTVLWKLFPENPYLLECDLDPLRVDHVVKPFHSREGSNIRMVRSGTVIEETSGPYTGPQVYQRLAPLHSFDGKWPVVGAWIVGDTMCGLGVREDPSRITRNTSSFVPHVYVG